jgi:hypothetical protein
MLILKKNDRLVDVENNSEWTFDCKTRAPDTRGPDNKLVVTWTYVLTNKTGERRFIPESKMNTLFKPREVAKS